MARILIVDDSSAQRAIIKLNVSTVHEVFAAKNGEEALDMITDLKPDCIVTDLLMPIMDGVELLRRLRSDHIETPVIVLTANSNNKKIEELHELKVNTVLRKPFRKEVLLNALEQNIAKKAS